MKELLNDYAYACHISDTTDSSIFTDTTKGSLSNNYYMEYYPNVPSAGVTRSVRFIKNSETDLRLHFLAKDMLWELANFNCGIAEEN